MAAKKIYSNRLWLFISILVVCAFSVLLLVFRTFETYSFANSSIEKSIRELDSAITIGERKTASLYLPILVYHYVEFVTDKRDTIRQSLSITPHIFESQLLTLITHGYEPVTMSQVADYFENKGNLPPKPVVLSFDDGYRDFYTDVLPILSGHHIPAVLYVTSGFLDSTANYLTASQLLSISQNNLVEIDSHTVSHPDLRSLSPSLAAYEIEVGKRKLEQLIGRPVEHFAYPFGGYNPELVREVEKAGFKTAVTSDMGETQDYKSRYLLKRIRPGNLTGQALLKLLRQP